MSKANVRQQRRDFLSRCATLSLLGSGAGAMSGKLNIISSALANNSTYNTFTDYKALVCVFLYGGSDSFSMYVPTDASTYSRYAASRGKLAIPQETVLATEGSSPIGFHPHLTDLHALYNQKRAAVVSNVGNLIAPVTRADYQANSELLPADLFAHNHQQEQWLKGFSSSPASMTDSGWGGRMADLLQEANTGSSLPPGFSLSGSNYWLPGRTVQPLNINPTTGLNLFTYLDDQSGGAANASRERALDFILDQPGEHPLKQQVAATMRNAKTGSGQLASALASHLTFDTAYDQHSQLATQLRMVSRLIAANQRLGMRRQLFFVGVGGWDTHDNQTPRLNALLTDLNRSLADFQATLDEINLSDSVTTFTASDFGRTLTVNGDGSDHGWGSHHLVMGGAVNGGQLYGELPSFTVGAEDDVSDKGRVIPQISINQYGAILAEWMGVSQSDLSSIFPDLSNFDSDWRQKLQFVS